MPNRPATHPAPHTLKAFGLGKLDDASAASVMSHLENCPDCRQAVASVSGDSFVAGLRQAHGRTSTPAPAPALAGVKASDPTPTTPPAIANLPPELANHPQYQILSELGRGGMGVVYLAHNTLMARREVLKVMNKELLDRPGAKDRFLREIQSAAMLNHPNVVAAYSALQLGDLLAFAMEYVEGKDLAVVVKARGQLPVMNACYYIHQAAQGLEHACKKNMVHRDIKPSNLILARQGKEYIIKILDFGLAKATSEKGLDLALTGSGVMLGTPHYIAPEQALDAAKADIRADIYSLGCTLYYLLAGGPPLDGKSLLEILQAHQSVEARALNLVRPEVPVELAAVVAKMMAKDPAKRYQRPIEVAQALTPLIKPGAKGKPSGAKPELSWREAPPPVVVSTRAETMMGGDTSKIAGPRPGAVTQAPLAEAIQEERADPFANLTDEPIAPKKAAPSRQGVRRVPGEWYKRKSILAGVVGAVVALGLLAGVVFKMKTSDGDFIVLEVDQPGAEVFVDGQKIDVKIPGDDKPVEIKAQPGEHQLRISKDGFEVVTRDIELKTGKSNPIKVRLEPAQVATAEPVEPQPEVKAAPSPQPERRPGDIFTNAIGMKLAWIPPGTFVMGSPPEEERRLDNETQHKVTLTRGFYMGVYLVTQAQWQTVMGNNPSHFKGDDLPVETVSWDDCQEFCRKLSQKDGKQYRLPTEAEWEYACRAETTTPFSCGETISTDQANYNGNFTYGSGQEGLNREKTTRVGRFPPNLWGLYDMHGNVFEWCADWYGEYKGDNKDPKGKNSGQFRVLRGGSWSFSPLYCRSAYRDGHGPGTRYDDVGCRLCFCLD